MESREKRGIRGLRVFLIAAIFMGIVYLVAGVFWLPEEKINGGVHCEEFQTEWKLVRSDGTKVPVKLPGRIDAKKNEIVTVETILPETFGNNTYLCFWSLRQDMWFYIDGILRHEYSTKETRLFGRTSSAAYVFLEIMPEDAGKRLTVKSQTDSSYTGAFRMVYIGDRLSIWQMTFQKFGAEIVVAFLMLVLSIIGIISSGILSFFYHKTISLKHLSWGVLLAAVWLLSNSVFRQVLFSNISVASDITFLCVMLLPLPFLLYMNSIQRERYERLYLGIGVLTALNCVFCTILQVMGWKDFAETIVFMQFVCMIGLVCMSGTIIVDMRKGYIREYPVTAIGLFGAFLGAVAQIFLYVVKINVAFSGIMMAVGLTFLMTISTIGAIRDVLRMEQEKKQAVLASESKAQFLANMSHEIRTPINAVLGMDEMILRECTQENIREYALDIQNAGRSLLSLINDILDFSKIESGKLELVPAAYELSSLMNDCYNMISMRAKEKNLRLLLENNKNLPKRLFGDEVRIRQIIINLLTNAVKYTHEGSVTLSVDGEYQLDDTFLLIIEVKDTGMGIAKEDQKKLFESFQRVEELKNRNIEGSGLGLAITKQLVDLMQGQISVESTRGVGSVFRVEFLQTVISEEAVGEISEKYVAGSQAAAAGRGFLAPEGRILVVDDVGMNLKVIVGLLKNTRLQIDTVQSGEECLSMVQRKQYHVIFLDHMMPGMDGIETLQRMKQLPENQNTNTPVIMLTANAILGAKEEYLSEGFADYLSKPVRSGELEAMLVKYLPEELVSYGEEGSEEEKLLLERLSFLDTDTGMLYCAGSEELYFEVLQEYRKGDKRDNLKAFYDKEDWENYRIQIHAVKSTSLSIGATELSEEAKQLEFAAKEGNISYIREHHEEFVRKYEMLLEQIEKVL